jgi:CDP-glucose 4,6-dehydratase
MELADTFWAGKRVFVTGHTGFKGGWLSLWLTKLGADVFGYALAPPTDPSFFVACKIDRWVTASTIGDVRDDQSLRAAIQCAKPDIVFHLAAQSLVRYSYEAPAETYATNVMGTVNLFEAVRTTPGIAAVVNVTTDKCYEIQEWPWPYREADALGGHDPYSSSKACSEIVTAAYRRSFMESGGVHLASARAGNVIGGGDWALDRLLPDFLRALDAGEPLVVRSPSATRPWQHVLEPLSGYLALAKRLFTDGPTFADAWNFGPTDADARTVSWIVEYLCSRVASASSTTVSNLQPHEAHSLRLDSSKAHAALGWRPRWNLDTALERALEWHLAWRRGEDMATTSLAQIAAYTAEPRL